MRRSELAAACLGLSASVHCNNDSGGACAPGDQDGISGGNVAVFVTVSDTAFAVGGVDSGSTERNITVENLANVTLTLTNVGTRPHDLVVQCIPTGMAAGCPTTSCFQTDSGSAGPMTLLSAVAPGQSATTTFVTPAVEGAYPFISDEPGDTETTPDGGLTGLVGEFVLM
jgi:hypothetical protein